jgi:hypothetical protein
MTNKNDKSDKLNLEDTARKAGIYGGNYLAGVLGNYMNWSLKGPIANSVGDTLKNGIGIKSSISNPVGGIAYGALDIARNALPKYLKGNMFVAGAEAIGTAYYSISALADLFGWLNGNWGSLVQLPFDVAMAYEIGRNFKEDFSIIKDKRDKDNSD